MTTHLSFLTARPKSAMAQVRSDLTRTFLDLRSRWAMAGLPLAPGISEWRWERPFSREMHILRGKVEELYVAFSYKIAIETTSSAAITTTKSATVAATITTTEAEAKNQQYSETAPSDRAVFNSSYVHLFR